MKLLFSHNETPSIIITMCLFLIYLDTFFVYKRNQ